MASIFISCVSDEFAKYRDAIRRDFTRPNLETKIQEDFIPFGGPTLEKVDEYIQRCDIIIHICGDMIGSMANDSSVQYIKSKYPDLAKRYPLLQTVFDGTDHLSYTQWEAYLALYHGKRLIVVSPKSTAARDVKYKQEKERVENQKAHLNRLKKLGYYDEIKFNNEVELVKDLYRSNLGDILNAIPKTKPSNLPYQTIGRTFKGRDHFMEQLHAELQKLNAGITGIAVYGLGGVGKTRLAVEYAWKYKDTYNALLFINAGSPETLKINIANLSAVTILNLSEHSSSDEDLKYAAVINWLNQYENWLIILDNVDTEPAAMKVEELFAQLQHGHVLITSRLESWSSEVKAIRLDELLEEDAITFLLETTDGYRQKTSNDYELAKAIAKDVDYLALALEQARGYIKAGELSFETYRKEWESNREKVLNWFDERLMKYPASVAITWQTSFDQLSGKAKNLLNMLAWLAPDPIPKSLLDVKILLTPVEESKNAWQELKKYSLVKSNTDRTAFTVHKLVQEVTRIKINESKIKDNLEVTIEWISDGFIGDPADVNFWPVLDPLIPHVINLFEHTDKYELANETAWLINQVSLYFFNKEEYKIAEPLLNRSIVLAEQKYGTKSAEYATRLVNYSLFLRETNRYKEAEPLLRKAIEIDKQVSGENHTSVGLDINNLAMLLLDTDRFEEAEPLIRKALEIAEQNFKQDNPIISIRLNNLAQLLYKTHRFEEAEPLMRRVLEMEEDNFGTNHPNVARALNNLAQLLKNTNRLQEAEPLMIRALIIDENRFGPNNTKVAIRLNNLGLLFFTTERLHEAEPLIRRALKIFKNSYGISHSSTNTVFQNYSELLKKMGKTDSEIQTILSNLKPK